jgi:AcrR family transcriptional regulator
MKSSNLSTKSKNAAQPNRGAKGIATRQAILQSALAAFTQSGYDGAGVREIAKHAGVTAMMVNRYFGSKEGLFVEVVETTFASKDILTDESLLNTHNTAIFCRDVAAVLLSKTTPGETALSGFLLMLKSSSNEKAVAILRDKIAVHFEKPLAKLFPGALASERAALFLSVIAGFQLMRKIIGNASLQPANQAKLSKQLAALFQLLVEPPD